MTVCPNCHTKNIPGEVFCSNCGTNLSGAAIDTYSLDEKSLSETNNTGADEEAPTRAGSGDKNFPNGGSIRLKIRGFYKPVVVVMKPIISFGRPDPVTGFIPDVDFTHMAGYRMGVSRRHAQISLQGNSLILTDLASRNGTMLNGTRLPSGDSRMVCDGDTIQMGQLSMRLFFEE